MADLPTAADQYQLPTVEGIELDTGDPIFGILQTRAFENGIGQAGFAAIITDYATALSKADGEARTAALGIIGDNAEGRINAVSTWLGGKLPVEQADALRALTADGHALLALEKLMNLGVQQVPPVPPPPPPQELTHDQVRELMRSKEYSGKPHERKQEVIDKVTKWFQDQEAKRQAAAAKPA